MLDESTFKFYSLLSLIYLVLRRSSLHARGGLKHDVYRVPTINFYAPMG